MRNVRTRYELYICLWELRRYLTFVRNQECAIRVFCSECKVWVVWNTSPSAGDLLIPLQPSPVVERLSLITPQNARVWMVSQAGLSIVRVGGRILYCFWHVSVWKGSRGVSYACVIYWLVCINMTMLVWSVRMVPSCMFDVRAFETTGVFFLYKT
jgi:hypothetical protein